MMKTALLVLSAAGILSGGTNLSPEACPAPAASVQDAKAGSPRFDPLVLDLKGDGAKAAAPGTCSHAINTKGTGAAGRAGPGGDDCDDKDDSVQTSASRSAPRESLPSVCAAGSTDQGCGDVVASAIQPPQSQLAIKCKGTSAK